MTITQSLIAFVATASVLTIAPGLDTALVLRTAAGGGARSAGFAALGIAIGCFIWGSATAFGLGALLAASTVAFNVLRWAGAIYLGWLGVRLLMHPRTAFDPETGTAFISDSQSLSRGMITNLLNPKVGIFYISFLPQFVPPGSNIMAFSLLLVAIHILLGLCWFGLLIASTVPMARLLRKGSAIRNIDRITGGIFLLFGAKLILARR